MRIGVDLGGTKIEILALGSQGQALFRKRIPTPRQDYEATLLSIRSLVEECESASHAGGSPSTPVGLGHPGAISPATGRIKNANSVWLNGRPFGTDLERTLGRRVRLANDANCFALSEATDGAAAGARTVFGVILGTGTGGGIVVDGRVLTGPNAIAGEWGHNPLPWPDPGEWPGPACYCGRTGCIETFLSGPGLLREYRDLVARRTTGKSRTADLPDRVAAAALQEAPEITPEAIVSLAETGEPSASEVLDRYVERAARALAGILNVLDPDVIVLGGGMSNVLRLYTAVPAIWQRWTFSDRVDTPLVRAKHGDSSGVRGAAWLWPDDNRGDST